MIRPNSNIVFVNHKRVKILQTLKTKNEQKWIAYTIYMYIYLHVGLSSMNFRPTDQINRLLDAH